MTIIKLKGHITKDGKLEIYDLPKDLPEGDVQVQIKLSDHESKEFRETVRQSIQKHHELLKKLSEH